ncbi:MAG: glycosyltransferase family 39 protein [Candidatus Omnitrophica bacterium]|nr:glycosyltransferase family 39 protein [Candidatus Omnitrophota bacterium]
MNSKLVLVLVLVILIIGFCLRLYAAYFMPLVEDEAVLIGLAAEPMPEEETVSYDDYDSLTMNYFFLLPQIAKAGYSIFRYRIVPFRILSVLLGTLSLLFFYKLVAQMLGQETALIALCLLTFSQYHIGANSLFHEESLLLFFLSLAVYFFFKSLDGSPDWLYAFGASVVLGCVSSSLMFMIIPVFFIFLLIDRKRRLIFRRKTIYICLLYAFFLILPYFLLCSREIFCKLFLTEDVLNIGFSLRGFYMYFAEIVEFASDKGRFFCVDNVLQVVSRRINDGSMRFLSTISNEFVWAHWMMGLLVFTGFFRCLKKQCRQRELILFSLIMFAFILLTVSILAGGTSLFDDHWWAGMSLFPGIILASYMLNELRARGKAFNTAVITLIAYFGFHSLYYIFTL